MLPVVEGLTKLVREIADALWTVNLHAVEQDDVVLRAAAAHRERALLIVGRRNAGKRREHLKDVLEPPAVSKTLPTSSS